MTPRTIALLVVFLVFAVFVVQNVEAMDVRFLFWHMGASRALVLIGTFGLGLLAGWLTLWLRRKEGRAATEIRAERGQETGTGKRAPEQRPGQEGRRGGPPHQS